MSVLRRLLAGIDRFQRRHRAAAVLYAIVKKYGDDNAGSLASQLTFSMFLTVFPLLLLLVTLSSVLLAGDPSARARVASSAFGQFPIVGSYLAKNVHALHRSSILGLVFGVLGLAYGCRGLAQTGQYAMAQIWNIPMVDRPGFLAGLGRSMQFLGLAGIGLVATTVLSGFGTFGSHAAVLGYLAEVVAIGLNVGLFFGAFRLLTPKVVGSWSLWRGSLLAGAVWTGVQAAGGYVVGHDLKGASATYGMFAIVLGLVAWISLGVTITLYAAELNAVRERRLWPRGLVQPPLTEADERSLALQVLEGQRRKEQRIQMTIGSTVLSPDEFAAGGVRREALADDVGQSGTASGAS